MMIETLIESLHSPDHYEQRAAIKGLAAQGEAAVPTLLRVLRAYGTRADYKRAPEAFHAAELALVMIGRPALRHLLPLLYDPAWGPRTVAEYCLDRLDARQRQPVQ